MVNLMERAVEPVNKTPEPEKDPPLKKFVFHIRYSVLRINHPRMQVVKERECWVFHHTKEEAIQALALTSPDFVEVIKNYPERSACQILQLASDEVSGVPQDGGGRNRCGPGAIMYFQVKEIESWEYRIGQEKRLENALKISGEI
ncbi:MAG: hypothetical protein AAB345_05100 [Patescibacteria group bacterium]